jgi:hypothetical protein
MKVIYFAVLALGLLLIAEVKGELGSSTLSNHEKKPLERSVTPPPSTTSKPFPQHIKPPPSVPQRADYLHPGILVLLNGKWEGSDHLLNLQSNIGVYVTILKPETETLEVTNSQLEKEVAAIFEKGGLKPLTLSPAGKAPLPAFEIEIFIYPIEKGYAAFCDGRLFETAILDRFKMDPNMAFQAITWEKQNLIVGPKSDFAGLLTNTVKEIAETFVERVRAYERVKGKN